MEKEAKAPGMLLRLEEWGAEKYGKATAEEARKQRIQVMDAWLVAGLPVSRLDDIRGLLGELGVDMADSSHLRQYIPFLLSEERLRLGTVMKSQYYSISFDGTPLWHQECFGIMARIVTEDLVVVQNLIHLHLLECSMNSNHIAAEITDAIEKKNKLPRDHCVAFMYDSASPNLKSIREVLLPMFFTGAHGLQCLSHMFNNTGERIDIDIAQRLVSGLKELLSQSFRHRQFWKTKVGKSWKSVNSVRWGAGHDVNQDVLENFMQMRQFLAELMTTEGKDNKKARQLLRLVEDPIDGLHLQLQLAVVCDVGRVITKATYALESDKPMIEKAWDIVQEVVTLLGVDGEQLANPVLPNFE
ncbi:unnamed protein product, partial [Ectocarpus sp. 8 AP-2014]